MGWRRSAEAPSYQLLAELLQRLTAERLISAETRTASYRGGWHNFKRNGGRLAAAPPSGRCGEFHPASWRSGSPAYLRARGGYERAGGVLRVGVGVLHPGSNRKEPRCVGVRHRSRLRLRRNCQRPVAPPAPNASRQRARRRDAPPTRARLPAMTRLPVPTTRRQTASCSTGIPLRILRRGPRTQSVIATLTLIPPAPPQTYGAVHIE